MKNESSPTGVLGSPLVRLIVGLAVVLLPVALVQLLIITLPISKLWQNVLLGCLTPPVALGAYYGFVRLIERRQLAELALHNAPRELMLGSLMGALLFSAVMAILALSGSLTIGGTNHWSVLIVPLIGAVTSGVFEELLFRGVLYRILEGAIGSWLGLIVSGLIFGGLHLINPNATLMGAVAVFLTAGILLGALYTLTGRLWLSIGLHFAWNFTQSGVFGLAVSGNAARPGLLQSDLAGPAWLTGGEFGPEASIATVVLGFVAGAVIIWQAARRGRLVRAPWMRNRA